MKGGQRGRLGDDLGGDSLVLGVGVLADYLSASGDLVGGHVVSHVVAAGVGDVGGVVGVGRGGGGVGRAKGTHYGGNYLGAGGLDVGAIHHYHDVLVINVSLVCTAATSARIAAGVTAAASIANLEDFVLDSDVDDDGVVLAEFSVDLRQLVGVLLALGGKDA